MTARQTAPLLGRSGQRRRTAGWLGLSRPLVVLSLGIASLAAHAASADDKRLALAKEAARRAQAAAQQAQQERDSLRQQQAATAAEKVALAERLARAETQARGAGARQVQQQRELATAQGEIDRLRGELAAERTLRERAEANAADTAARGQQALQSQRQVTAALSELLEKSVQALARAEQANRELHGLGLQAVEAYTQRTPEAMRARSEPFLQLGAVRLENEADALRRAMDAQRVAP